MMEEKGQFSCCWGKLSVLRYRKEYAQFITPEMWDKNKKKAYYLCVGYIFLFNFLVVAWPLSVIIHFSASAGNWMESWQQLKKKEKYSSLIMRRKTDELMTKRSTRSQHLLGILDDDDDDDDHKLIISTKKAIFCICGYCLYSNIFKCPQTTWTPWREQLMLLCCCYGFVLHPHANIQVFNMNRLTARTKVHCAAALVQATGRCWGCYPQRPDAGTRDGRCQTPPLILVPFRPRHSD